MFLKKLLRVSPRDQYFYLLFQGMAFLSVMTMIIVKATDLLRFFKFVPLFIRGGYHMRSFP
jgi:hypothetical protein